MRFVLVSRHTDGSDVPESERDSNMKAMGEWLSLVKVETAMPIRGGKTVTAKKVDSYEGDVGGVIIFNAGSLDEAVAFARKSPGLKYGFTHEVFPEVQMGPSTSK